MTTKEWSVGSCNGNVLKSWKRFPAFSQSAHDFPPRAMHNLHSYSSSSSKFGPVRLFRSSPLQCLCNYSTRALTQLTVTLCPFPCAHWPSVMSVSLLCVIVSTIDLEGFFVLKISPSSSLPKIPFLNILFYLISLA